MVVVRKPTTQDDYGKLRGEFDAALDKVQEYFGFISRTVDRNSVVIKSLNSDIEMLSKKKMSLESSVGVREDEIQKASEKKAEGIVSDIFGKAKKEAELIVFRAKTEVSELASKKANLEKEIEEVVKKSTNLHSQVRVLEVEEASLKDEVSKLTSLRNELRKQVASIKESVSSLA